MHCKHLLHYNHNTNIWSVASCSAKNTPYVPSLHELERYCQNGRHAVCPAYLFSFHPEAPAKESRLPAKAGSRQSNPQRNA
ncbi:MAG: hypothetical protein WC001_05205 [Desulfurivibrionaceae bacterium]